MHCALRLFLNRSSGFACEIEILTHPGLLVGHGSLLVPHPCVWLDAVSVKSWSMNEPQAMVIWVKLGAAPAFSDVLRNTVLLIVLAFSSRNGWTTDANLGPWPFWKAGGTKRTNFDPAEPCATLHRLLHVPSKVRYQRLKHASTCLRGSQLTCFRVSSTSCAELLELADCGTSYTTTIITAPRKKLNKKNYTFKHELKVDFPGSQ